MNALVVYETMFGNTRQVAEAIAQGLAATGEIRVVDVADAPRTISPDLDLVVVGGPTHAFSMSRPSTRSDAVHRGAEQKDLKMGIREWLGGLDRGAHPQAFAAFDTRVDIPLLPGAASKRAAKVARRLGFRSVTSESFRVGDYEGPVLEGELDRAREWGASLATAR